VDGEKGYGKIKVGNKVEDEKKGTSRVVDGGLRVV
jgi:hypothetical protein